MRTGHARAGEGVYVTRPERIIWPVIALVAVTLFSAALDATVLRVRSALDGIRATAEAPGVSRPAPPAEYEAGHEYPADELKPAGRPGLIARQGQRPTAPDGRAAARRSIVAVVARAPVLERRVARALSHRQVVVSPRRDGLVVYFPTAPPASLTEIGST